MVDEVGEEDAEHHHDEDRAEDQEEVLVHVEDLSVHFLQCSSLLQEERVQNVIHRLPRKI